MDYGVLARSYNTLDYPELLKKKLIAFFKYNSFDGLTKYELHQKINSALFNNYEGEEILKYKLAKTFLKKDYIAAFEVRVLNSRADFLVINGDTKCFEVKSKIDTLFRLKKQTQDYSDVFEYNTVVVDEKHLGIVQQIIPDYYGIWTFSGTKNIILREAQHSPNLNPTSQLSLLTKKELLKHFGSSNIFEIVVSNNDFDINNKLKDALKLRYTKRWAFIKENWESILPIDLQFFFNTNVSPELIYNT
ncbi:MAG: hypothetical protein EHM93_11240 [Bacteroidales bacterium]|nr:MAG: hypothetical protein EHM93_11240 [Bacteroidales bacterium]